MPDFENVVLYKTQLEIIAVENFIGNYWYGQETSSNSCHYTHGSRGDKDKIVFFPIFGQNQEVLNPSLLLWQMDVLLLVNNKLEVNLKIGKTF